MLEEAYTRDYTNHKKSEERIDIDSLRDVKYFNDCLYYKIDFENYFILLNKKGHLKKCLIFETTEQKLYYGVKHFKKENKKYAKFTDEELVKKIFSHIKFKIYKKIKIRLF